MSDAPVASSTGFPFEAMRSTISIQVTSPDPILIAGMKGASSSTARKS